MNLRFDLGLFRNDLLGNFIGSSGKDGLLPLFSSVDGLDSVGGVADEDKDLGLSTLLPVWREELTITKSDSVVLA